MNWAQNIWADSLADIFPAKETATIGRMTSPASLSGGSFWAAAAVLAAVKAGQSAAVAITDVVPDLRPAAQGTGLNAATAGTGRALRRQLARRAPPRDALLCTALAWRGIPTMRPEVFTLVNQTVKPPSMTPMPQGPAGSSTLACAGFCASGTRWFAATDSKTRSPVEPSPVVDRPAAGGFIPSRGESILRPTMR